MVCYRGEGCCFGVINPSESMFVQKSHICTCCPCEYEELIHGGECKKVMFALVLNLFNFHTVTFEPIFEPSLEAVTYKSLF